jgi:hypothetical protein
MYWYSGICTDLIFQCKYKFGIPIKPQWVPRLKPNPFSSLINYCTKQHPKTQKKKTTIQVTQHTKYQLQLGWNSSERVRHPPRYNGTNIGVKNLGVPYCAKATQLNSLLSTMQLNLSRKRTIYTFLQIFYINLYLKIEIIDYILHSKREQTYI